LTPVLPPPLVPPPCAAPPAEPAAVPPELDVDPDPDPEPDPDPPRLVWPVPDEPGPIDLGRFALARLARSKAWIELLSEDDRDGIAWRCSYGNHRYKVPPEFSFRM